MIIWNIKYKIIYHQKFKTNLIVTYSAYNDGRTLIEHLKEELMKKGFVLNPHNNRVVY